MNKKELENRVKDLELELSNLKSGDESSKKTDRYISAEGDFKYQDFANNIPAYIAYVDANTLKYEIINDLYEKSFGIPRGKIIGSHIKDVIGETNYKFALKYIKEVKSGKAVSYENTFDMASGKRWIQVNYSPVFDTNSKVIGIALVSYDITERKQSERALIESEERFQLLFDKAPLGYQSLDFDGNFIDVNQTWLDTLGYARDEVIGKWFGDFLSSDYQDGFRKRFPIFKAQGHIHSEFEIVHKNGNKLFIAFEGKIGYDLKGEFKQTHCILQDITESKRAEEKLKKSEERLRLVVDATPFPIALVDTKDDIIKYWSRSAIELFGHTAPTADEWYKVAYPDDKYRREVIERWKPSLEKARLSKEPVNTGEYRVTCSDGSVLICELYATFIEDNLVVTFNNITDRKQSEEHLKVAQQIREGIINSIPARVFWKDINSVYLGCNKAFADDAGLASPKDIIGKNDNQMSWSNLAELYLKDDIQVITSGKPKLNIEESLTTVEGNILNVLTSKIPLWDDNDEVSGIIGTYIDITERKVAELELIKAKEKAELNETFFKAALENSQAGIAIAEMPSGKLKYVNKAALMIRDKDYDEIVKDIDIEKYVASWQIQHFDGTPYKSDEVPLARAIIYGETNSKEFIVHRDNNEDRYVWANAAPIHNEKGTQIAAIVVFLDTTDKKRIEFDLIKAKEKAEESDRLKSAFLANMSHEIRTPMNGILGFTELLIEPNLSTDDQKDFIQTIQISGERMLNTINNIVDVSKIESGLTNVVIDETNINKKIEFTYKFFKPEVEKKGLQFIFKNGLPTMDAVIRTDNEKVYGVLANLIKNAIKFTYDGSVEFGYEKKDEFLEFYVKDTGVGIPKNQKEFIFERFRQGSNDLNRLYEGSGLGLSIAKSYVEMLGGKIWVESEEGKGSTFYFTIPYHSADGLNTEIKGIDSSEIKKVQMKNLKILIVEDDEVSYSLLKRNIQKFGKEVLHAITGIEAIETCRTNPDLDLVLMDIRMPIMDGIEATRQIRQFNKDVVIIAQTAYAFAGDSEKAIAGGCNDYITKPINMTLLFELIKKNISK